MSMPIYFGIRDRELLFPPVESSDKFKKEAETGRNWLGLMLLSSILLDIQIYKYFGYGLNIHLY